MKSYLFVIIIVISFIINGCCLWYSGDEPTPTPGPETTPVPTPVPVEIWSEPETITTNENDIFTTEIYLESSVDKVGAFGFSILYDENIVDIFREQVNGGIDVKIEIDSIIINKDIAGEIIVGGYTTSGIGPGLDIDLLTIYWQTITKGECMQQIMIDYVSNTEGKDIGGPYPRKGGNTKVIIE